MPRRSCRADPAAGRPTRRPRRPPRSTGTGTPPRPRPPRPTRPAPRASRRRRPTRSASCTPTSATRWKRPVSRSSGLWAEGDGPHHISSGDDTIHAARLRAVAAAPSYDDVPQALHFDRAGEAPIEICPRAPAQVRRLVAPQGQAEARRGGPRGRAARGGGGDRLPVRSRAPASPPPAISPRAGPRGRLLGRRGDPGAFTPNREVDRLPGSPPAAARNRLTQPRDRAHS